VLVAEKAEICCFPVLCAADTSESGVPVRQLTFNYKPSELVRSEFKIEAVMEQQYGVDVVATVVAGSNRCGDISRSDIRCA
jgi:hypothetical protein